MITRARGAAAIVGGCSVAGLTSAPAETLPAPAQAQTPPGQIPSPGGAKLYIINLKDDQEVTSPFLVQFGHQRCARGKIRAGAAAVVRN